MNFKYPEMFDTGDFWSYDKRYINQMLSTLTAHTHGSASQHIPSQMEHR